MYRGETQYIPARRRYVKNDIGKIDKENLEETEFSLTNMATYCIINKDTT